MPTTINPSGQTITQYNIQTGGASNLLNNVAPSATSGVPVISQGASSQPVFGTAAIAGGGTNATSFTQSAGIVVYNGTSLVNYAGPQITSGGVLTNTSQPVFNFYLGSNTGANKTGDGTTYTLGADALTQQNQQGSGMSTNGTFTAPVTGYYIFTVSFWIFGLLVSHTNCTAFINVSSATTNSSVVNCNPFSNATGGQNQFVSSVVARVTATSTVTFSLQVSGSTKVIGFGGGSGGNGFLTYVSGALLF